MSNNKRPSPPDIIGSHLNKRFASPALRNNLMRRSVEAEEGAVPTDPSTFQCTRLTSELLLTANIPVRLHQVFLHADTPRVIPDAAATLLYAIHGDNDIRRARGEYFLACSIGRALNIVHAHARTNPLLTPAASQSRLPGDHDDGNVPVTAFFRYFLTNPIFLLHGFAPIATHRDIASTELSLHAPCPFCFNKMPIAQDYFRGIIRCPRSYRDIEITDSRNSRQCLMLLLTNRNFQLHCDTAELSLSFPESERAIYAAAHRLLIATIEEIRSSFDTDLLPWLDFPLTATELDFLREQTKDYDYSPDLKTPHPDASRPHAPNRVATHSIEHATSALTQDLAVARLHGHGTENTPHDGAAEDAEIQDASSSDD
jgi:hypothetical protein